MTYTHGFRNDDVTRIRHAADTDSASLPVASLGDDVGGDEVGVMTQGTSGWRNDDVEQGGRGEAEERGWLLGCSPRPEVTRAMTYWTSGWAVTSAMT